MWISLIKMCIRTQYFKARVSQWQCNSSTFYHFYKKIEILCYTSDFHLHFPFPCIGFPWSLYWNFLTGADFCASKHSIQMKKCHWIDWNVKVLQNVYWNIEWRKNRRKKSIGDIEKLSSKLRILPHRQNLGNLINNRYHILIVDPIFNLYLNNGLFECLEAFCGQILWKLMVLSEIKSLLLHDIFLKCIACFGHTRILVGKNIMKIEYKNVEYRRKLGG
jgi:hypothetical protein